jgi:hypothetical protein
MIRICFLSKHNARIRCRKKGRGFCIAKNMTLFTVSWMRLLDEAAIAENKSRLRRIKLSVTQSLW